MLPSFSRVGLGEYFPFLHSEPETYLRVIYVGGPCKAHDRLRLADLRTQYLVLGLCLYLFVAVRILITAARILSV